MTTTGRPVTRRTVTAGPDTRRRLVARLGPGDVVWLREERRRRWVCCDLHGLYARIMRQAAGFFCPGGGNTFRPAAANVGGRVVLRFGGRSSVALNRREAQRLRGEIDAALGGGR